MSDFHLGIHAPVQGATQRFHDTAAALGAQAILWLPAEQPSDAARYPDALHIVRLDNWTAGEDPTAYANRVAQHIKQWFNVPGVIFQCGNEPELDSNHDGSAWPMYADRLHELWAGIRLANPPLKAEDTQWWDCATLMHGDFIAVHCYWQLEADISNPNLGEAYGHVIDCGRPVIVTEANVSPVDPSNVDWNDRNNQVAEWAALASQAGVYAATLFIADASPDWAGFNISPSDATQINDDYEFYMDRDDAGGSGSNPGPEPAPEPAPTPPNPDPVTETHHWMKPAPGAVVQGSFGDYSHGGNSPGFFAWDIDAAPFTDICATQDGRVSKIFVGYAGTWPSGMTGNTLILDHANGEQSLYGHLREYLCHLGMEVKQGDVVALSGGDLAQPQPGRGSSSGGHLHWEGWRGGVRIVLENEDVGPYQPGGYAPEEAIDMLVETSFDDAELQRLWDGPKTEKQKQAAPFNKDFGIPQAWATELRAGRPLGFAVSGEESDPASGRVVQYFANGKITFFPASGRCAIN